ncbi:MAG: hypothetical protein KKD38_01650, partial [Candidatus Delongbacteria bacterium]|nr:hypothetical protein [Candidatus Delongbacteria bacterium]MCG2760623.1 hypothetical protein [Candidatus Delongbacteria bacterium]
MLKKIIAILFLIAGLLLATEIECITYCSITKGFDVKEYGGILYFGTDGGLIVNSDGENKIYDSDDGLYKVSVTCVEKDFRNLFWLGHNDCSFSVYDINKKSTEYLNEIEQSGIYSLNKIYSSDKFIYIAT